MNINFRSQRLLQGYDFLQSTSESKPIKVLVHEFIQTVIFTPFPQDSELQVERLTLAGNIYQSIGFKKKAALYKRFAALKSATAQSNWRECYDSLIETLDGFGLNLDPIAYERSLADKSSSIWPGLHVQLIEELVTCCKRIQNGQAGALAIRHMSFMLHTLDFYLSAAKKKEFAQELEEASTTFGEDSPVPLKLSNGFVVPTVNLTRHPLCLKLEPCPLPMSLRPVRIVQLRRKSMLASDSEQKSDNPFIFTPIVSHSSLSVLESRKAFATDIVWVQDEPCTTVMLLRNTLPFELKISSIKLLTDGVPLETKPHSLKLNPDPSGPELVSLIGIPRQFPRSNDDSNPLVNKLEIFGYSTHLLGVKSNCRLDMIPKSKFPSHYSVEISPPLPRIEFQFPESLGIDVLIDPIPADQVDKNLVVMEFRAKVYMDETIVTNLTILNSSNVDVDYIYLQEKQTRAISDQKKIITWKDEVLDSLVSEPLESGKKLDLPLSVETAGRFSKVGETLITDLLFEYSGGMALKEMYCRKCVIRFHVISRARDLETQENTADASVDDDNSMLQN